MKALVADTLAEIGININGSNPWDIIVHDDSFYKRVMANPELGLAECYMDGIWDCAKLDQFIFKVLRSKLDKKILNHPKFFALALQRRIWNGLHRLFNYQTQKRAFEVGYKHYDIGNDLYKAMLDKRMVYTCGYWNNANTLDEAQEDKLQLSCQKLNLQPGMTLLDIGCGFGSLAKFAAEFYGVSVVGVTISKQQCELARKNCEGLPVEIRFQDYRDLLKQTTKFDRIASLGMFEHVGHKNYDTYMKVVSECLKPDGLFLLHTIGGNISLVSCTSNFINKYIFPNGVIPSVAQIGASLEGNFVMEDWHNFGNDYDKTLMAWHQNFNRNWETLKENYDERFRRMWNYYLLSCAGSFRARQNQLWQIVLSPSGLLSGYQPSRYQRLNTNASFKEQTPQTSHSTVISASPSVSTAAEQSFTDKF